MTDKAPKSEDRQLFFDDDGKDLDVGDKVIVDGVRSEITEHDGKRHLKGIPDEAVVQGIEKIGPGAKA